MNSHVQGDLRGSASLGLDGRFRTLDGKGLMRLWTKAVQIRTFEDKVMELYMQGLVPGTTHLSQGHEGVSVGAIAALGSKDLVSATYRGHHHALSLGVDPYRLLAEMMGRSTGNCGGMGGSTHAATAFGQGLLGTSLIIGSGISIAVGAAVAKASREQHRVVLCFFGDGASNAGAFHEGLNMAALWRAPVVFVVENNAYAEYTPYSDGTSVPDLAVRAMAYGMPGCTVDGQDAVAVAQVVSQAVHRARTEGVPSLIEAKTYRFSGHSRTDPATYRPPGELARWRLSDPLDVLAARIRATDEFTADDEASAKDRIRNELDVLASRAAADPWPTIEDARGHVFA